MAREINILHLSDLHYSDSSGKYNREIITESLLRDIESFCVNFLSIDLIFFTGDLVNAADEEDVYYNLYDDFIAELSKIARCDEGRIFLCPGNHDIQQEVVNKQKNEQSKILERGQERNSLNSLYENGEMKDIVSAKFAKFFEFSELFANSQSVYNDNIISVHHMDDLPIDVICLNTSWASWAGLTRYGSDERNLLFPEQALKRAIDRCRENVFKVFISHHPISWFTEYCEVDFLDTLRLLTQASYIHLYGHMHSAHPRNVSSISSDYLSVQSGALYAGRDRYNGYSLISLDLDEPHPVLHLRSYFDKSRSFSAAVDIAPNEGGRFFSSEKAARYWHKISNRIDRQAVRRWVSETLFSEAKTEFDDGILDRPVGEMFVPPPMYLNSRINEVTDENVPEREEKPISLPQIVRSNSNHIFYARQEYGKTTLLQQIALQLMEYSCDEKFSVTIPIMLSFQEIKAGKDRILRSLRGNLQADLPKGINLSTCLEEGLITILIDDVVFSDSVRMRQLREFVSSYRKNRYLFTTSIDEREAQFSLFGEEVVPSTEVPISFEHIRMKAFTRNKMRNLVRKWSRDLNLDEEELLNRLIQEISAMHIPSTAVNGSILLAIYEEQPDFTLINRATLVDRFVEHVLEKRSYSERFRGTFDFKNKVHILSYLAEHIARNDLYSISRDELIILFRSYLDKLGLSLDIEHAVNYFLTAKILAKRDEGYLSFRYRAFLEYFIASQIRIDEDFRQWVFSQENYLRFVNEIHYYAGLERNDSKLLSLVGERFDDLNRDLSDQIGWNPDPELIAKFSPPASYDRSSPLDDIERQLSDPPLTDEERDEILNEELPQDAEFSQERSRPVVKNAKQQWYSCLFLYTGLVKNLELIPDDIKRDHLSKLLLGWSNVTAQVLALVPRIAEDRKVVINGVLYEMKALQHLTDTEVARIICMDIPNAVSGTLMAYLGTAKLQRQLLEPKLEEHNEPMIFKFFRQALVIDLRLSGWSTQLPKFVDGLSMSEYLTESFLRKMSDIYFLGGLQPASQKQLQSVIGEVVSKLRGRTPKRRKEIKSQVVQNMAKRARFRMLQITAAEKEEK